MKGCGEFFVALVLFAFGGGVIGWVLGTWYLLYVAVVQKGEQMGAAAGAIPVVAALAGAVLGTLVCGAYLASQREKRR